MSNKDVKLLVFTTLTTKEVSNKDVKLLVFTTLNIKSSCEEIIIKELCKLLILTGAFSNNNSLLMESTETLLKF